jgi:mannitol/fructose-specific phosphotransferase system IIA component (Ntr-type)
VQDIVFAVGSSERGVAFAAPDGEPVHTVVLFLVPAGNSVKHLNTLAHIAKSLQKPYFAEALKNAQGDEEVMRLLGQA